MPAPLLATPSTESPVSCGECGDTLIRTGKVITFADVTGTTPSARMRGHKAYKGWVPSLLVTICPTCDGHVERPDAPAATAPDDGLLPPTQTPALESYLERLGRLHDEGENT